MVAEGVSLSTGADRPIGFFRRWQTVRIAAGSQDAAQASQMAQAFRIDTQSPRLDSMLTPDIECYTIFPWLENSLQFD